MTEFIDNQYNNELDYQTCFLNCVNYADFLRQPLTLGMFVPVDEEGNVFKNPHARDEDAGTEKEELQIEFNNALEKVLFETDFEMDESNAKDFVLAFETVDNLAQIHEFNLTESAIKQIGL